MKVRFKYRCIILSVFALLSVIVSSPAQVGPFKNYDVKDGLSENSVRCIMQDSSGYMWFGTKDGLSRFNGVGFTVFGGSSTSSGGRKMSVIELCPHSGGKDIWVATLDSLYLFDPMGGNFEVFDHVTEAGIGVTNVFKLCYDRQGVLWIATGAGLFSYDEPSGALSRYTYWHSDPHSLPDDHVWTLLSDSGGTLWVGTRTALARYDPVSDNFRVYRHTFPGDTRNVPFEITSLVESADGNLWAGTRFDGLARFDKDTGTFSFFRTQDPSGDNSRVRALHQYSRDTFFIGTEDGLLYFDPSDGVPVRDGNLGCIYSFYRDREGGVWIGSYFNGVYYVSPKSSEIEWYFDKGTPGSLSGNAVSQFCEDGQGNIWIATEDGGLSRFDPSTGLFTGFTADGRPESITSNNIHALLPVGGDLWLGTFSKGIDIFRPGVGKVANMRYSGSDQATLSNNHVYSIYQTTHGEIYVGTLAGFCRYLPDTGGFYRYEALQGVFVYDMCEDAEGDLWIATRGEGIWRYSRADDKFRTYRYSAGDKGSPPGNWVIRVFRDRSGDMWFCTDGNGVCRYVPGDDSFVSYNGNSGLPNNVIYGILDDEQGNYWLSSNSGIIRFDTLTRESKLYTYEDGLQSNQFNFRSSMRTSDGKFYFGGLEGFNCFYPGDLTVNSVRPNTVISGVYLNDGGLPGGDRRTADTARQYVRVPCNTSSFEIAYECLSFVAPGKNRYAYRIDNIHDDWIYTDKMSVSFVNLPHGRYRFRVKGTNNDGIWSDEASTGLRILPAPWQTVFAKIVYALVLLTAAMSIYRYYARRTFTRREQEKREMELATQQDLYKAKLQFFTHVAHEIKTPVSLIKAPLQAIESSGRWDGETEANLSVIKKNTLRLLELIKQLLDFRKVDSDAYELTFTRVDINSMLDDIIVRFGPSAAGGIGIVKDFPAEHLIWNVDAEAVTKIVSNLLSNALKYARSLIRITLSEAAGDGVKTMKITVRDDGPGIPAAEAARIFDPFYQSGKNGEATTSGVGIGLSLVKLLVEKHSGRVHINGEAGDGFEICVEIPEPEPAQVPTTPRDHLSQLRLADHGEDASRTDWNILVVEDTGDMLEFLARNLGQDYNIDTATNGVDAVGIIKSKGVDLVISDIVMPVMDGFELLRTVRGDEMLCHIPFILLSARDSVDSKIQGLDYGADAYIEKPFSLDHLKATVNNLLENRKLIFERFATSPGLGYEKLNNRRPDMDWLKKLNRIITGNFTNEQFTVDTLVAEMGMSRSNLQRKLKGLTGLPPNDYIRLIRLKTAAEHLREGRYRVNEVGYLVGFTNLSYFARCFQKQFGVLPREYAGKKRDR